MAHRALALKYRPQTFSDMIGQEHVTAVLTRALEGGRVAHAYLFTGARGVGKTTCARLIAKALNCEQRGVGGRSSSEPCNACTSCGEITSGVSLDVTEIDGASNRGIADVQALRENVRFSPTGGRHRVVIIDEVHQLSGDAFAALLKTLEEPPAHLVFVFATTDPQKLPETIRSRTQRFDFARVPLRKVADRLLDIRRREAEDAEGVRFGLTEGAALLLAHKSEGSMRDAVSALDQVVSTGEPDVDEELVRRVLGLADRDAFFALAGAILERDPRAALHRLHEAFDKGLDARDLAEGLSEHIRHILVLKVDPEAGDLVALARDDLERLIQQGVSWSENDLLRLLKLASEASWPMRDSPQPLVHLEAAVLQMATLEPGETLAEILEKLEALERRLAGAPPAGGPSGRPAGAPGTRGAQAAPSGAPVRGAQTAPSSAPGALRAAVRPGPGGPAAAGAPPRDSAPEVSPRAAGAPPRDSAPEALPRAAGASRPWSPPLPAPRAVAPGAPAAGSAPTPVPGAAATAPIWPGVSLVPGAPAVALEVAVERDEESERRWLAALAGINARKRMLGAFLEESRFVGLAADAIVIGMDDLHRTVVEEKDNRALVLEEVERAFGRALLLRCAPLDSAPARRRPAIEDVEPMVERAIEFFQGEAVEPKGRRSERTEA
jgi:DNA polymerase-3 subunit gamma/tau